MLIDTHAHLTSKRFRGNESELLQRASQNGVNKIITIGCDLEDSSAAIDLCQQFPGQVYGTVGIHPCYVHEVTDQSWLDTLEKLATSHPVSGIGEIGLDYYHPAPDGFSDTEWKTKQAEYFEGQLDLAARLDLPVVVHQRESGDDVLAILANHPSVEAVLHCFTGTKEQAERALTMGHRLSFTGVITYPKAPEVRDIAAMVPSDRFMVETDSPYLAPVPYRGKSNEPAYVSHTAEKIAEVRRITTEECALLTTSNALQFFRNLTD